MSVNLIPTLCLGLAIVLVIIFNVFFIVVFTKRRRLRTPATLPVSLLLLHLAVIDIIAALLWTLFTLNYAAGDFWKIEDFDILCRVQVYFMTFCNIISAHTLMALMFERFLWIFKPSKHQEIVFDFVVVLFLIALYAFDGGIATFTLWGFGGYSYFDDQYQCAVDYELSTSHFQFTLAMHFWIPVAVILGLYIAILIRIKVLQRRREPGCLIVLEENLAVVGDSYADRLKQQYNKFQGAGSKFVKPKVKESKIVDKDGFASEDDDFNSSDEELIKSDEPVMSRDYQIKKKKRQQRKIYNLSRNALKEAHMYAIISAVYFILWMPYVVRSILWTYYFLEVEISRDIVVTVVVVSHFCSCFKVPFYLLSDRMKAAMKKTMTTKKNNVKQHRFDGAIHGGNVNREMTTEL